MIGTFQIQNRPSFYPETVHLMIPKRQPIVSVTAADCEWTFSRSSGAGGQNVNKRETKVRCVHRPSGAEGVSQETRHQHQNRVKAFKKMTETPEFKRWIRLESSRRSRGETYTTVDDVVAEQLQDSNLRVEIRRNNKWVKDPTT